MSIRMSPVEAFTVRSDLRGPAVRLRLCGELDEMTSAELDLSLERAEADGNTAIVLDLERVTFVDSRGLRSFLRARERASLSGRSFTMIKAPASVQRVLQITKTSHLFAASSVGTS